MGVASDMQELGLDGLEVASGFKIYFFIWHMQSGQAKPCRSVLISDVQGVTCVSRGVSPGTATPAARHRWLTPGYSSMEIKLSVKLPRGRFSCPFAYFYSGVR